MKEKNDVKEEPGKTVEEKNEIIEQRYKNLEMIKTMGIDPFLEEFPDAEDIGSLKENYSEGKAAKIAGRIMARREHGKSAFVDIKDFSGRMQAYFRKDVIGDDAFELFKKLDIGDIIGVSGELFKTRTGEDTIKVSDFKVVSKSLLPLPEKWHGLKDVETRYRQRYVDLIVNDDAKEKFKTRIKLIRHIRDNLDKKGFFEVETPMMHPVSGGAAGKPFKTRHEALDMPLYLRVAPELYLKKLLVGGFEKVFEINRSFRNEGISVRHNPEFTMLEAYQAYSDCDGMMKLTEDIIRTAAKDILGAEKINFQGKEIDLTVWKKVSFADLMDTNFGIRVQDPLEDWVKKLKAKGIEIEGEKVSKTQIINIVGEMVEPQAENHPVFVVDMFKELSPLAKSKKDNPGLVDRFELYMGGMEIANAYSELNDPVDQRERFENQVKADPDAMMDEDFIRALEYGMPPAGGLGIGIDRLAMLFTDSANIREVIFFPHMRQE
ncbi:MAG: lysine--tRNA ligase [Candidatus Omnitrophica bacterium]|nr:lysine--tRNA ligase [Candidatus Omnitrophota bacterium]